METYRDLKARHQKEVNDFPLGAAFSEKQFEEMMSEFGLEPSQTDKICSIGEHFVGMFCKKEDLPALNEMFERHNAEKKEAMQNEKFAYEAFVAEMFNHECGYTGEFGDAISALDLTLEQINSSSILANAFIKARDFVFSYE